MGRILVMVGCHRKQRKRSHKGKKVSMATVNAWTLWGFGCIYGKVSALEPKIQTRQGVAVEVDGENRGHIRCIFDRPPSCLNSLGIMPSPLSSTEQFPKA